MFLMTICVEIVLPSSLQTSFLAPSVRMSSGVPFASVINRSHHMNPSAPLQLDHLPDAPASPASSTAAETGLRRTMGPRHLIMIAMGGVIGSGLFLSSG